MSHLYAKKSKQNLDNKKFINFDSIFVRIPMNYLILNLAVADILVALFVVPRFVLFNAYILPDGMTGTVICKLLTGGNLSWIGAVASAFTLAVVALERYYAIMNPQGTQLTAAKVEVRKKLNQKAKRPKRKIKHTIIE